MPRGQPCSVRPQRRCPSHEQKAPPAAHASRRYHDRVARQYDSIYEDPYWEFHDELTWRLVKPYLPTDLSVACADLGCGTGKWGLRLLKSGFAVTFVDNSAAMIGQARGKLDEMGARGQRHAARRGHRRSVHDPRGIVRLDPGDG